MHKFTESSHKAHFAERGIGRLKKRLEQIRTYTGLQDWSRYYKAALKSINSTPSTSTGFAPLEVERDPRLAGKVFQRRFGKHLAAVQKTHPQLESDKNLFPVGTKVRVLLSKSGFEKGTAATFSTEVFTVAQVRDTRPIRTYVLKDSSGDDVTSSFYPWELEKAEAKFSKHRRVQRIFRRNKRDKKLFVSWKGHPEAEPYRTWISEAELKESRLPFK